ncbi:MAG: GatB/YqeY domain-containing protein [Gammaproteobacteria bacterium]|nr:GatB/YqeY domain-containing protein [Gammaproteobacteria bacterium]MDH4313612.1 GatB/YqeY domain-containing protein [Gammaproteobacteria bacterium]MDH5213337.1 GatB/YqeY domain-containing protein [Gammaproteobacteria bacterium]MDH5500636.1 GatB/YqeY domain-containing protein [Gammaproteobacteria bacterium]
MTLKSQIQDDMKTAMKAGDKDRLKVVRLLLAAIKQVEVDERIELDDAAVLSVINKMVKQRRDSVTQFQEGGRNDLAEIETAEISVLEQYLPEQLSDAEIDELINKAIADAGAESIRDMGKVMARIKEKAQGRADMGRVGAMVKARLAGD